MCTCARLRGRDVAGFAAGFDAAGMDAAAFGLLFVGAARARAARDGASSLIIRAYGATPNADFGMSSLRRISNAFLAVFVVSDFFRWRNFGRNNGFYDDEECRRRVADQELDAV